MSLEEHFVSIDGIRIRYLVEGSGPAVVLLHAAGESARDWQWMIPRLAGRFRLYAPDLPGYTDGSGNGVSYTTTAFAGIMTKLIRELDISCPTLIGNSLGGLVALRMAMSDSLQVPALVMVGSAGLGKEINPFLIGLTAPAAGDIAMASTSNPFGAWLRSGFRSLLLFANPSRVPPEWFQEQYRLAGNPSYRHATLASLRAQIDYNGQREVLVGELPKLDIPVLVLWGGEDQIIPVEHGRKAMKHLRYGKIEIFPDCGHIPQVENPDRFSTALGNFLEVTGN